MKVSHGLMVAGLSALAALASAAELTTFQAGQVASASEVNGNFQRLAAEDEAIRAELEAAIEEGNARLDTAIEEGNAVLQEAIDDGTTQLEALQTQLSALLEEVDGLTARLAQLEDGSAGAGSTPTTTTTVFSPVGTWTYLTHETGSGFNSDRSTLFSDIYGERGILVFSADGSLRSAEGEALSGGVFTSVNRVGDGVLSIDGSYEEGGDTPILEEVFPVNGTWSSVQKANGAVITVTILDTLDDGQQVEFSFDVFKGSSEFLHTVILDNEDGPNGSEGLLITSISLFKHSE